MPLRALLIRPARSAGITVFLLIAAIMLMLGLSAAPNLHERVHPAATSLHECAVTLIASGSCHHTAAAPFSIVAATDVKFSHTPALTSHWVGSPFLAASIFEHAPPANS
jgi:hypothetical protein